MLARVRDFFVQLRNSSALKEFGAFTLQALQKVMREQERKKGLEAFKKAALLAPKPDKRPEDLQQILNLFLIARKAKIIQASYPLGLIYLDIGEIQNSFDFIKEGADFGAPEAQYIIACFTASAHSLWLRYGDLKNLDIKVINRTPIMENEVVNQFLSSKIILSSQFSQFSTKEGLRYALNLLDLSARNGFRSPGVVQVRNALEAILRGEKLNVVILDDRKKVDKKIKVKREKNEHKNSTGYPFYFPVEEKKSEEKIKNKDSSVNLAVLFPARDDLTMYRCLVSSEAVKEKIVVMTDRLKQLVTASDITHKFLTWRNKKELKPVLDSLVTALQKVYDAVYVNPDIEIKIDVQALEKLPRRAEFWQLLCKGLKENKAVSFFEKLIELKLFVVLFPPLTKDYDTNSLLELAYFKRALQIKSFAGEYGDKIIMFMLIDKELTFPFKSSPARRKAVSQIIDEYQLPFTYSQLDFDKAFYESLDREHVRRMDFFQHQHLKSATNSVENNSKEVIRTCSKSFV